jgi:hypothetical protein
MDTDVKEDQVVDGQGVAQVASGNGVAEADNASTVLADGTTQDDHPIPKKRFDEVNEAKKVAEEELELTKLKLEQSVQLQMQTSQQRQVDQTQQPGSTFELAMQQLNITADDLYVGENLVKVNRLKSELDTALQQQQTVFTANQQFIASHSDFTQVVGSVDPATGRIIAWSNEALLLQQKMPYLANLQSAKDVYGTIIDARKLSELEKITATNKEHLDRQNLDTNTVPMGGSAAGGGGAGDPNSQQLLTREQTQEIINKLNNGEQV